MAPVVRALLIANVAVFFVQITQPAITNAFVFVPWLALSRPWTIITYMFLHGGWTHIGFNMLALYFFGPRVEERLGSGPFTWLYFISGISGALTSFVFSPEAPIIGASAGVFGVSLAFAMFWPHTPILIWGVLPVPARMLVIITTVMAIFGGFSGAQGGIAHFAHLGGYGGAYLYLRWFDRSRQAFKRKATAPPKEAARRIDHWQQVDLSRVHEVNREELNRILDKIAKAGVTSLSEQERLFLSNFVPDDRAPPVS